MASSHRTFRLSPDTDARLGRRASELGVSRTELVERLLAEGLRLEAHPRVSFRWVEGTRRPFVGGIELARVLAELRSNHGDVGMTANLLRIDPSAVEAALAYHGAFRAETDLLIRATIKRIGEERAAVVRQEQLLRDMKTRTPSSPDARDTVGP